MWKINLVGFALIALNLAFFILAAHDYFGPKNGVVEILISLPVALVTGCGVWWLLRGGKWR